MHSGVRVWTNTTIVRLGCLFLTEIHITIYCRKGALKPFLWQAGDLRSYSLSSNMNFSRGQLWQDPLWSTLSYNMQSLADISMASVNCVLFSLIIARVSSPVPRIIQQRTKFFISCHLWFIPQKNILNILVCQREYTAKSPQFGFTNIMPCTVNGFHWKTASSLSFWTQLYCNININAQAIQQYSNTDCHSMCVWGLQQWTVSLWQHVLSINLNF